MSRHRSIFLHGLFLTLRRFPAVLWTYLINLGLALLFSIRVHGQLAQTLDHSLHSQRLVGGFDLTVLAETIMRFHEGSTTTSGSYAGVPLYVFLYFIMVPGVLYCYQTGSPARLSTLLQQGLLHFWRFVRITILTLIGFALILGPLSFLQNRWSAYVEEHILGRTGFILTVVGFAVVFLVATLLRLYFDLVEVYTVQLGLHQRRNGKPDRRVRRALGPAWRTFRSQFGEAWPVFLFLTLLGAGAVVLTARISMHSLASSHVWPSFLLAQAGLFILLFTRFWQRAAETSLSLQHPHFQPVSTPRPSPFVPTPPPMPEPIPDPIPAPEPAAPSLDGPDPAVYHPTPPTE